MEMEGRERSEERTARPFVRELVGVWEKKRGYF